MTRNPARIHQQVLSGRQNKGMAAKFPFAAPSMYKNTTGETFRLSGHF